MKAFLRATLLGTVLCGATSSALADDIASETRNVDARAVNINLDGVINLRLKQGAVAALTISGDPRYLSKVVVEQHGDSLHIGTDLRGVHTGKQNLSAELTLPALRELVSGGVGATDITGFKGDNLRVVLDGAGAVNLHSQYRNVNVKLAGAGSMNVDAGHSDNVNVELRGAGRMEISGESKALHADLGGVGSLEAQQLRAEQVDLHLTGVGSASVYASNAANLTLTGMGSATVYGKPATRNASARGLGSVRWQ